MGQFVIAALIVFSGSLTLAAGQVEFACDSFLRRFPSMSIFFQHCECRYGNWTDVIPLEDTPPVAVPHNQCESGLKILGVHYQHATGGEQCDSNGCVPCTDRQENTTVCKTDCQYVAGSDVMPVEGALSVKVPRNQCESGWAIPAQQYILAVGGYKCNKTSCRVCEDKYNTELYICEPPLEQLLVATWDLGDSGQNTDTLYPPPFIRPPGTRVIYNSVPPTTRPPTALPYVGTVNPGSSSSSENQCTSREVCADTSHRGRRSRTKETKKVSGEYKEAKPLPVNPIQFDFAKHRSRYRRQSSYCHNPGSVRHVLFMLDTSGSIGDANFHMMANSLSKLVGHFCHKIKIAVMVFNHDHYVEFCFNCFDNDCTGRNDAKEAMRNIQYRGGWTHTASATQCACAEVLKPSCGFDSSSTRACLDVVYITDGHSNDPHLDACSTVECLHYTPNTDINIFVIGIGDEVNEHELSCIAKNRNPNYRPNAIFRVDDFQTFSQAIEALDTLFNDPQYRALLHAINPTGPDCVTTNPAIGEGTSHEDCSNA